MATTSITIQIIRADYPSLQVGDIAFYATPNDDVAGFKNADEGDIKKIGEITAINNTTSLDDGTKTTTLTCNIDTATTTPTTSPPHPSFSPGFPPQNARFRRQRPRENGQN